MLVYSLLPSMRTGNNHDFMESMTHQASDATPESAAGWSAAYLWAVMAALVVCAAALAGAWLLLPGLSSSTAWAHPPARSANASPNGPSLQGTEEQGGLSISGGSGLRRLQPLTELANGGLSARWAERRVPQSVAAMKPSRPSRNY